MVLAMLVLVMLVVVILVVVMVVLVMVVVVLCLSYEGPTPLVSEAKQGRVVSLTTVGYCATQCTVPRYVFTK